MKLHEIEVHARNHAASREFYRDVLGLNLAHERDPGLMVFGAGHRGVDFDVSERHTGQVSVSFLVADVDAFAGRLRDKGVSFEGPVDTHLEMRAISLHDPDGLRIEIQSPTAASPDWLKKMTEDD